MNRMTRRSTALALTGVLAIGGLAACEDDGDGIDDDVEQDVEDDMNDVEDEVDDGMDDVEDDVDNMQDEVDGDPDDGGTDE